MTMANPGSIYEQFIRDRESKEYLFQFPGAHLITEPWTDLRTRLDEKFGFQPRSRSRTSINGRAIAWGQRTTHRVTKWPFDATWTVFGRENDSPTMIGFEFLYRDKIGTNIPPVALFTQAGSLYPTSVAFR